MRPFLSFIKMQLNVNYGVSALKYRLFREKKKRYEPILIAVALVVALLPLLSMYILFMAGIFAAGVTLNQPEIVLTIAILISQTVILFFGLFYIMGTFYFSKDIEALVPLPLKPYEVIGGKFVVILVNEYLTSMPILLPPIIIYGVGMKLGLIYWIKSVLILLTVPVIPLAVGAVIIVLLMRVVNFRRYKDLFAVVGGLLSIAIGMGISMFSQNIMPNGTNQDTIQNLLASQTGLIETIGRRFPPSIWATMGLASNDLLGLGYLLLFLIVSVVLFILLLWMSNKIFYKTLLAGQEFAGRKKTLTDGQRNKQIGKISGAVTALVQREWRMLFRTPIYLLNGVTGSLIGPIMLLIMFLTRGSNDETVQLFEYIKSPEITPYVLLGGLAVMLFTAGMNIVPSTALSREGQTFWITKTIPVPAKHQVTSKFIVSYLISALGIFVTGIIMLALLSVPPLELLGTIIVGLIGAVPMISLALITDVYHPKLVWSSEQEAMKQNMNGLIGMVLSLLILVILGVIAAIMLMMRLPMWLVFIMIGAASLIIGILSLYALFAVAEKKYYEHEG